MLGSKDKGFGLKQGSLIGETYTIDHLLGQGGFGEVYAVRHRYLGMQALKLLFPSTVPASSAADFLHEAFLLSQLQSPHIVRVYEANKIRVADSDTYFLAMELLKGFTLETYLREKIRMPIPMSLKVARHILRALILTHNQKPALLHRDIKPQNIMICPTKDSFLVKLLDFGVAKHVHPRTRMTNAAGSLLFMPPEGLWNYEMPASDVFSTAIVIYRMLTGIMPFKLPSNFGVMPEAEAREVVKASRRVIPRPPSNFNSEIPQTLDRIILKALSEKPTDRFPDATAFYQAVIVAV